MWEKNKAALQRLSEVIRTDATTPTKGDFLITHSPFDPLYLNGHTRITEKELLENYLLDPTQMEAHKFIMIQGGNGSGKTHLIRWLKEKYEAATDRNEEAVILIQRAHNNLQDAMMQLLESDIFPEEVRERTLKQLQNARGSLSVDDFKKLINFKFKLEIENDSVSNMIDNRTKDRLPQFISNPYILNTFLMKEGGPLDRMRAKIETTEENTVVDGDAPVFTADDFAITISQINTGLKSMDKRADADTIWIAEQLYNSTRGKENREKVASYLNTKVSAVIRNSMDLKSIDFQHIFEELRKNLKQKGMKLTLFLEDINAFTGIDEALMEALLVDHRAEGNHDCCRLTSVVGSTIWFYENKLNSSIRERISFNVYLREGSVISEHHLDTFTARYINAINLSSKEVDIWYQNGANEDEIPLAPSQYPFAEVNINGRPYSLFPFTENALSRLYSTLEIRDENNSSRTPRVVLNQIIQQILDRWYTLGPEFLSSENNFVNNSFSIPRWTDATYEVSNSILSEDHITERSILLRIWGDGTTEQSGDTVGGVSAEIFKAFGIPFPGTGNPQPPKLPEPQPPKPPEPPPPKYVSIEQEIDEWCKDPKAPLRSHVELREDLIRFILNNTPWIELEIPYKLAEICIQKRYVNIEGQTASNSGGSGIILSRNNESRFLLLAMARWKNLGGNSWEFENGLDYYTIAMSWLEKHLSEIRDFILTTRNSKTSDELAELGVFSVYCMKLMSEGFDDKQSTEDAMITLFRTNPDTVQTGTGYLEKWKALADGVHEFPEVYALALSFFRKSIGGRRAEEANYMFIDAYKLYQIVSKFKSINWSLDEYCLTPEKETGIRTQFAYVIQLLQSQKGAILKEAREEAHSYQEYFSKQISQDLKYNSIRNTIQEMQEFLKYLTKNNLSYDSTLKDSINASELPTRTHNAIQKTEEILSCNDETHLLSILSKGPFAELTEIQKIFIQFDRLLREYEKTFTRGIDQQLQDEIEHNLRKAKDSLSIMESQYRLLKGGTTDGRESDQSNTGN